MAYAEIKMPYIEAKPTYFICEIWYKIKKYQVTNNSIRIYYSTTASITSQTPYVSVNNESGAIIDEWTQDGWNVMLCRVPLAGTPLEQDTCYWLRARLELFKNDGTSYKKYRAPKNPTPVYTGNDSPVQKLFQIASYSNPHTGEDGDTEYDQTWVDFTDCISVPTYNVNYEDITEDWEDANYVTHRIVPRSKVKGTLEMLFQSKGRYYEFLKLIKMNRTVNGKGYIMLRVQVNNDLEVDDIFNPGSMEDRRCTNYIGTFFLTMDNNPWVLPIQQHYGEYDPLKIDIVEA